MREGDRYTKVPVRLRSSQDMEEEGATIWGKLRKKSDRTPVNEEKSLQGGDARLVMNTSGESQRIRAKIIEGSGKKGMDRKGKMG